MGLKKPPSKVQLPGGIVLKAIPFNITAYNEDGSPKSFEVLPSDSTEHDCWLYANEEWIRGNVQAKKS